MNSNTNRISASTDEKTGVMEDDFLYEVTLSLVLKKASFCWVPIIWQAVWYVVDTLLILTRLNFIK